MTTVGRNQGEWEKYLYQMCLFATPLAKLSIKLADMYSRPKRVGGGVEMHLFLDSDPDATVDPRLVLQLVASNALLAYSQAVRDEVLLEAVRASITELKLLFAPRVDWMTLPVDRS